MGFSDYTRNAILGALRNEPFVVGTFCGSLHAGDPGDEGTNEDTTLIEADGSDRAAITMAAASSGVGANTGDPATWVVDADDPVTVTHIGLADALTEGNWLGKVTIDQPTLVADGDTVQLTTFTATFPVAS